jgi:hypothetical protein
MATRRQKANKRATPPTRDKLVRKRKPSKSRSGKPNPLITRLNAELREALAQQAATAEVLEAINASAQAPTAVFDVILEKVMRLCAAAFGYLMAYDGERFRVVASHNLPARFAEYLRNMDQPGSTGLYAGIRRGSAYGQVADLREG